MSETASKELCEELYRLSGWGSWEDLEWINNQYSGGIPAYDLGYLLRKLPKYQNKKVLLLQPFTGTQWLCHYEKEGYVGAGESPEDAVCDLAIELFKQGVLKREAS